MTRPLARRFTLVPLLAVVALIAPLAGTGNAAPAKPQVTVMTRNLYLGADLGPAVAATSPFGFLVAVANIYGTMLASDFPTRAGAVAEEIRAAAPDLVGLQEVSTWTVSGSPAPSLDFLTILQAQLAGRGLHYRVAAISHNADIGPIPLLGVPCAGGFPSCTLRFQDSDVILVRTDRPGLSVGNPRDGSYDTQQVVVTAVGLSLSFDRGWATVDGSLAGRPFRFASTHLETEDAPAVQQAQAREFVAAVRAPRAVIAVGDFNSAADGSTTTSYAALTGDYFRDAASRVGFTCCQAAGLDNTGSQLHSRIDLVLAHGGALPVSAQRVGATPLASGPPFWPSDHAGVVAALRLP